MIPFLLGIGLRTLSIDIRSAPSIERTIASIDLAEAEELAIRLLTMGRISEIEAAILDR